MIEQDAQESRYRIRIDRVGPALAAGGGLCGLITALLLALGGDHGGGALLTAFVLGAIFSTLALAAIGGPVWLVLHALGWRGPASAAVAGALLGFLLFLFGQADLWSAVGPPLAASLRDVGSSLVLAALAAAVALVMWRIAYRRG